MKTRKFFAALLFSLLAACAQISPYEAIETTNIQKAAQNARTQSDHVALSKYFEEAAKEMQSQADVQQKLLEHYEAKGYLYGRQAQDLKSHTAALLRKYEANAEENIKEATAHRQMALEQAKREFAARQGQVVDIKHSPNAN
jgi:peptidoglycan hydrolase CwlO-like protein